MDGRLEAVVRAVLVADTVVVDGYGRPGDVVIARAEDESRWRVSRVGSADVSVVDMEDAANEALRLLGR